MYCSGCGISIDADASFCSLCGTRQPVAHAVALPTEPIVGPKNCAFGQAEMPYGWGYFHGGLNIMLGFMLVRPHSTPARLISITFVVVFGICILRRNKLILPLMAAWTIGQLAFLAARPELLLKGIFLPALIWCIYLDYYYRRRNEFVSWL